MTLTGNWNGGAGMTREEIQEVKKEFELEEYPTRKTNLVIRLCDQLLALMDRPEPPPAIPEPTANYRKLEELAGRQAKIICTLEAEVERLKADMDSVNTVAMVTENENHELEAENARLRERVKELEEQRTEARRLLRGHYPLRADDCKCDVCNFLHISD